MNNQHSTFNTEPPCQHPSPWSFIVFIHHSTSSTTLPVPKPPASSSSSSPFPIVLCSLLPPQPQATPPCLLPPPSSQPIFIPSEPISSTSSLSLCPLPPTRRPLHSPRTRPQAPSLSSSPLPPLAPPLHPQAQATTNPSLSFLILEFLASEDRKGSYVSSIAKQTQLTDSKLWMVMRSY